MSDRNWKKITTGATFEALASTIIFFEDPQAALFGRRGKDGGQDARSGDGTVVFQAKHHESGSAAKAIADAKKEAGKISKYREEGHSRYEQWKGVTHWRLVTNAPFNPTDLQKWKDDVVPLFEKQGLEATYWEQANLDALLGKHPEVDRAFFQNETRAFLTVPEIQERLACEEIFLQRSVVSQFVGRDEEDDSIREFLDGEQLFLVIHGTGGVGKTRLITEVGEQIASEGDWQVLWANIATMETSSSWFEAIIPERPTLVIVDEPESEQLLRVLSEQLSARTGRASEWKIALTVRSPKDPVLRFLFTPRMKARVDELPIEPLPPSDAESMCLKLIKSGTLVSQDEAWQKHAAKQIAKRFSFHPIWLTLAISLLETFGDLNQVPTTSKELADMYLNEIISNQDDEDARTLLKLIRWIALLKVVSRENSGTIQLLQQGCDTSGENRVLFLLSRLVNRKVLRERGANNRLVEIKPDVLRDHVLLDWLSTDVGFGDSPIRPSDDAISLVEGIIQPVVEGKLNNLGRAVLRALVRTEQMLKYSVQPVSYLTPFFEGIQNALDEMSPSIRLSVAGVLIDTSESHPHEVIELIRLLRESSTAQPESQETLFGTRELDQDDIVLELAWTVFHVAPGAETLTEQKLVLEELCALCEDEWEISQKPTKNFYNDGKRAKQLIERVLEGGPHYLGSFEEAAKDILIRMFDEIDDTPMPTGRIETIKALLIPSTSLERSQTWSEGYTLHFQRYVLGPKQRGWQIRECLLNKIKAILEGQRGHSSDRVILWDILSQAHSSVNRSLDRADPELQETLRQEMQSNLTWAKEVLLARKNNLRELSAARKLWDWHVRFEKDDDSIKTIAEDLEELYNTNSLASEFEILARFDVQEERKAQAISKASDLAQSGKSKEIESYVERATEFFGAGNEFSRVFIVAGELGGLVPEHPFIQKYIKDELSKADITHKTYFVFVMIFSWLRTLRGTDYFTPQVACELVTDLLSKCSTSEKKIHLLQRLYGGTPPPYNEGITNEECRLLRSHEDLFLDNGFGIAFLNSASWAISVDWEDLKKSVERAFTKIQGDQLVSAMGALVDSIYWFVREAKSAEIPQDLSEWLLEQLLQLPDVDGAGDMLHWHVGEILNKAGRPDVSWFTKAILARQTLQETEGAESIRAIGYHTYLAKYTKELQEGQTTVTKIQEDIRTLVSLASDTGTIGYYLPQHLTTVDPKGLLIPQEVARQITEAQNLEEVRRFARIAGSYSTGSAAWRTIAEAIMSYSSTLKKADKHMLYRALVDSKTQSWTSKVGEVPELFIKKVRIANEHLDLEENSLLTPFWEWNLKVAHAELEEQEQLAKEERGE